MKFAFDRFRDMAMQKFDSGKQVFFGPFRYRCLDWPRNEAGIGAYASEVLPEIALRLELIKLHFEYALQPSQTDGDFVERSTRIA